MLVWPIAANAPNGKPSPASAARGASQREWRTPPLWGFRDSGPYLHDGRAQNLDEAVAKLRAAGLRVETDLRNEKINYKVREHSLAKVPYLLVVGKREAEERTVAMRVLGGQHQQVIGLDEAAATLVREALPPDLRS